MSPVVQPVNLALRHPLDPEPVTATKARAVFVLGLIALLTGPFVGGVIPATIALIMARQVRKEAYAARGYLTGSAWVSHGQRLAWAAIVLACAVLVVAVIAGLLQSAGTFGRQDFDPSIN